MIDGYEAFSMYQSLKLHFNQQSYDFFKYNGKTNTSKMVFENRKDKYHFYKLARKVTQKDDLVSFLVANFVENENVWVGDLLTEDAEVNFRKHQKIIQSLSYIFENDCKVIFEDCKEPNDVIRVVDGEYPILLKKALRKEIHVETLCLLAQILGFLPMWNKKITDTIRWPEYQKKLTKYAHFLPKDVVKYKLILKKII